MRKFLLFLVIVTFFSVDNIFSQTSEIGNYNVYTREFSTSSIGFLRTAINLNGQENVQLGISYNRNYDITKIGLIPIDEYSSQLGFFLQGSYRLGITTGENSSSSNIGQSSYNKIYVGSIDFFSLFLATEFTYIIDRSYSVTAKLGLNLINVGGTLAFQDKRKFKETFMASINFLPIVVSPSIFFDFGRSGLGIQLFYNTFNILQYDIVAKKLTEVASGLKSMDAIIKKYDFQILFTF